MSLSGIRSEVTPPNKRLFGLLGTGFLLAGSLGHTFWPQVMAKRYGWPASPPYQRQLASFQIPHLYGLALVLSDRSRLTDGEYIRMLAATSLLLGAHHTEELTRGRATGQALAVAMASFALGLIGWRMADAMRESSA